MIIRSLLDTDLYVFTQMQLAFHQYRNIEVEYAFKCRTPNFDFRPFFERIQIEIEALADLRFTEMELSGLARLNLLKQDFLNYMRDFSLTPSKHVKLSIDKETGQLIIRIKGLWVETIAYETPILAIISEVCQGHIDMSLGYGKMLENLKLLRGKPDMILFEFGTRRRHSLTWQTMVFEMLRHNGAMKGSSNVALAVNFGVPAIGTVSHQYFQVMQAMAPALPEFLNYSLCKWMQEYPHECRSMLTDIVGYKGFLKTLNAKYARHYNSYRHDSGDPYEFADALINRLRELEIDPKSKIIVFSDGLDVPKGIELYDHYKDIIGVNIAIGTKLTNDFVGHKALSMVIKMVMCDGKPVAKISDSDGKGMCEDPEFEKRLRQMFNMVK